MHIHGSLIVCLLAARLKAEGNHEIVTFYITFWLMWSVMRWCFWTLT